MRYGVLQFLKGVGALLAALFVSFSVYLIHSSSFTGGESTYYLYCASSQAEIKRALSLADLAHLKGESAVYVFEKGRTEDVADAPIDEYTAIEEILPEAGENASAFAEDFISAYDAKLCFAEEIGNTLSFYCYSPQLKGGVILNGRKINLHIAVRAESVAVGTPIIFGGY